MQNVSKSSMLKFNPYNVRILRFHYLQYTVESQSSSKWLFQPYIRRFYDTLLTSMLFEDTGQKALHDDSQFSTVTY